MFTQLIILKILNNFNSTKFISISLHILKFLQHPNKQNHSNTFAQMKYKTRSLSRKPDINKYMKNMCIIKIRPIFACSIKATDFLSAGGLTIIIAIIQRHVLAPRQYGQYVQKKYLYTINQQNKKLLYLIYYF